MTEKNEKCTCPDTWDCPNCVYACAVCSDCRDEGEKS